MGDANVHVFFFFVGSFQFSLPLYLAKPIISNTDHVLPEMFLPAVSDPA